MARIVPFKRTLRRGDKGPDVLGMKRALVKAKAMSRKPNQKLTSEFGPAAYAGVRKFQQTKRLSVDGVYGRNTHRRLMPYFDAYGAWLMAHGKEQALPGLSLRGKVANEAQWGYNARRDIHYAQVRPMQNIHRGHTLPQTMDCSEFVTCCYYRGGASDPNGMGFSGFGYTGSLSQNGKAVRLEDAQPGDLVFYGTGWPYVHVAMYVGFGKVISHGSEGGPYLCSVDYRRDRHLIRSYL